MARLGMWWLIGGCGATIEIMLAHGEGVTYVMPKFLLTESGLKCQKTPGHPGVVHIN